MKSREVPGSGSQENTGKEEQSVCQCDIDGKVAARVSCVCLIRQFQIQWWDRSQAAVGLGASEFQATYLGKSLEKSSRKGAEKERALLEGKKKAKGTRALCVVPMAPWHHPFKNKIKQTNNSLVYLLLGGLHGLGPLAVFPTILSPSPCALVKQVSPCSPGGRHSSSSPCFAVSLPEMTVTSAGMALPTHTAHLWLLRSNPMAVHPENLQSSFSSHCHALSFHLLPSYLDISLTPLLDWKFLESMGYSLLSTL